MFTRTERNDNLEKYKEEIELIEEYISTTDFDVFELGEKVELTNKIFFFKANYKPKSSPTNNLENHKRMIDIHYSYNGDEVINVCHVSKLRMHQEYNKNNDVEWYKSINDFDVERKVVKQGEKLVLFPGEAHEPEINENSKNNTKIVFKIKY